MSDAKTPETFKHPNVEIAVKNFGPIAEATIDLRPLTVFVGPSNTGKTYFSTLIYALHGAFKGFSGFPIRFIQEILFEFEMISDSELMPLPVSPGLKKEIAELLVKLNTNERPLKLSDLPQKTRALVQSSFTDSETHMEELKSCFNVASVKQMRRSIGSCRHEMRISLQVAAANQNLWHFNLKTSESEIAIDGWVSEDMVLRPAGQPVSEKILGFSELWDTINELGASAGEIYYLPAARSGIMQSHSVIASSLVARSTRPGSEHSPEVPTFSKDLAHFLQHIILYSTDKKLNNEMSSIADALETNVLAGKIIWRPSPSGYPEFFYRPWEMTEDIHLNQASSMVSELAPLVLFIRGIINPGDTLIIEEPEAHLHPGAQTEIALTLAGLVRAGVHVVVTTHSDWLLKEIANLIRIGDLKRKGMSQVKKMESMHWLLPEEVGTWWFQKNGKVKEIPFDRTEGIEPKEYEDVADKLYDRSVNLQDLLEETDRKNKTWD